jgi:hypothetical protein
MSSHKTARIGRVLSGALRVWGASASIERDPDDACAFLVRARTGVTLRVAPAAPHGWLVFRGDRALGSHAGLPGLLRTLRQELAPQAAGGRLIIGSQPPV